MSIPGTYMSLRHARMNVRPITRSALIFFIALLGFPSYLHSQPKKLDSLRVASQALGDRDTLKIKNLYATATYFMYEDPTGLAPDSASHYLQRGLQLSEQIGYKRGEIIAYNYLGRLHNYLKQRQLSLDYFLKALASLEGTNWVEMLADINLEIGHIYYSMYSDHKSSLMRSRAFHHYRQVLEVCNESSTFENKRGYKSLALTQMSKCLLEQKAYDSALYFQNQALEVAEGMADLQRDYYLNLVTIYRAKKDYPKALAVNALLIRRLNTASEASQADINWKCNVYQTMALIYLDQKNADSAYLYLVRVKELNDKFKMPKSIDYTTLLCNYYFQKGKYERVVQVADTMLLFMNRPLAQKLFFYNIAAEANVRLGRFQKAFELKSQLLLLQDTLESTNQEASLIQQQADYESLLKTKEIKLLQEQERANNITIRQQQKIQWLLSLVALLLLVVAVIGVAQYRFQKKAKEQQAKLFQETDQLKSRFFANISHEFRTPLTLILGPIQDLISRLDQEDDRSNLAIAQKNALKLLQLVNQLLDLSKLEAGSLTLKASYQNLIPLLKQVAAQFSSLALSKRIDFTINHPNELMVWVDPDKFEKIISNLLANAFKFTAVGGTVTINVSLASKSDDKKSALDLIQIDVSDSGIGIPADKLEKVFDRFYQVNDSTKRMYEGSGIGLALVKELTELNHGYIKVKSEPGIGSVFSVLLPLNKDSFAPHELTEGASANRPSSSHVLYDVRDANLQESGENIASDKPLLMIVEDNSDLREYLLGHFRKTHQILLAANGEKGWEVAIERIPDLIISDLMMPEMDGLELCNKLKSDIRTSHIPIILLTAKADLPSKIQGLQSGADDYIAKPFELIELETRIQNLIELRKKLRVVYSKNMEIKPNDIKTESVDDRFLKKALMTIEEHISDELFGVEAMASEVGMSTVQLYRKLKALTGKTPNEVIRNFRLDRAFFLLQENAGNVSEIAYLTGFRNTSYFAKCFKEKFGTSPSEVKDSGKSQGNSPV